MPTPQTAHQPRTHLRLAAAQAKGLETTLPTQQLEAASAIVAVLHELALAAQRSTGRVEAKALVPLCAHLGQLLGAPQQGGTA